MLPRVEFQYSVLPRVKTHVLNVMSLVCKDSDSVLGRNRNRQYKSPGSERVKELNERAKATGSLAQIDIPPAFSCSTSGGTQ